MEKQLYGYNVTIDRKCVHSEYASEKYGDWHEVYNNTMTPLAYLTDKLPDVNSIHNVSPGYTAFVVWVEWTSGDSFGSGTGISTEVIGLFESLESAQFLKHALQEHNKKYDRTGYERESVKYHITTPDGQLFESEWAPWLGYFESFDAVNITPVVVTKTK